MDQVELDITSKCDISQMKEYEQRMSYLPTKVEFSVTEKRIFDNINAFKVDNLAFKKGNKETYDTLHRYDEILC